MSSTTPPQNPPEPLSGSKNQQTGLLTKSRILELVKGDPWMMAVLEAAQDYSLPDWMIGAGFVRNKVWDYLHGIEREAVLTSDIDLIYYDPHDLFPETEKEHNSRLSELFNADWSAKNQARMHIKNNRSHSYKNSEEALADWIETPTCVAVRLDQNGKLQLIAPHGIEDLIRLIVRPASDIPERREIYRRRVSEKNWIRNWPQLTILEG